MNVCMYTDATTCVSGVNELCVLSEFISILYVRLPMSWLLC